jgi:hypothetical protein
MREQDDIVTLKHVSMLTRLNWNCLCSKNIDRVNHESEKKGT